MGIKAEYTYHGPVIVFDLDDTLYKERDYALSGYRAVADMLRIRYGTDPAKAYSVMEQALEEHTNAFNPLYDRGLIPAEAKVEELVEAYRRHKPDITLPEDSRTVLEALRRRGCRLGLLTDGRSEGQRLKIQALGIEEYFRPKDIVISEEIGADKHSRKGFVSFMHRYPEARRFFYIGDNPAKDFHQANLLGWHTICLLDKEGTNIHPQEGVGTPLHAAQEKINTLPDLLGIVDNAIGL